MKKQEQDTELYLTFPNFLVTLPAGWARLPRVGPAEGATLEARVPAAVPQHVSGGGVILARVRGLQIQNGQTQENSIPVFFL